MTELNILFLEEYKNLDRLCQDLYQSMNGVTSYIDHMKNTSSSGQYIVPNWDADLKTLIHLRHVRNQLSHNIGTLYTSLCTQEDIDWLIDFRMRILNTSDPLALLAKKKQYTKKLPAEAPSQPTSFSENKSPNARTILLILAVVFVFLLNIGLLAYIIALLFC